MPSAKAQLAFLEHSEDHKVRPRGVLPNSLLQSQLILSSRTDTVPSWPFSG